MDGRNLIGVAPATIRNLQHEDVDMSNDEFIPKLRSFTHITEVIARRNGFETYMTALLLVDKTMTEKYVVLTDEGMGFAVTVNHYIESQYSQIAKSEYIFLSKLVTVDGEYIIYITGYCASDGRECASEIYNDSSCKVIYYEQSDDGCKDATNYAKIMYKCAISMDE